jgi:aconitate hydratase
MAYGASLHFNPLTDTIPLPNGETFRFSPPTGDVWPERGYERTLEHYQAPRDDGSHVELELDPKSERIQLIRPFEGWNGEDKQGVEMLIKVKGKCSESQCT